jgi:hypothetical protein
LLNIPSVKWSFDEYTTFIPDDSVTGSDPGQLDAFFKRCGNLQVAVPLTKVK